MTWISGQRAAGSSLQKAMRLHASSEIVPDNPDEDRRVWFMGQEEENLCAAARHLQLTRMNPERVSRCSFPFGNLFKAKGMPTANEIVETQGKAEQFAAFRP
jgi:hypothetical protein